MGMIIRFCFPLIGYFCVATVITLAAGFGYLRHQGILDDDRMFQIMALLHDIELDEVTEQQLNDLQDVPSEDKSFEEQQQLIQIAALHFHRKVDDLEKQTNEFMALRDQVDARMAYYNNFSTEVKQFLEQRRQEALQSGLVGVRAQWQNLTHKTQTKELLKKMIEDGRVDLVIQILQGMPAKKQTDILKTLNTPSDVEILYKIQKQMLAGHPVSTFIEQQIEKLEKRQQEENS